MKLNLEEGKKGKQKITTAKRKVGYSESILILSNFQQFWCPDHSHKLNEPWSTRQPKCYRLGAWYTLIGTH